MTRNFIIFYIYIIYEAGQLVRENDPANGTKVYVYDARGNCTSVKVYTYQTGSTLTGTPATTSYTYNLRNELTSGGITYDNLGNMTYLSGTGYFTWTMGRQLSTFFLNGNSTSYTYNETGLRTSKTVNGVKTEFCLADDRIVYQTDGTNNIYFYYDSDDTLIGFEYNGVEYYYVMNLQGDIIGILDSSGNLVVEYTYDSWGKLLSITGPEAATTGVINPFRYRGYYYDNESGFYYLQSRYYSPNLMRFISVDEPDMVLEDVLNLYSYCDNDSVNMSDPDGTDAVWLQANKQVAGLGHTGLLIQDKNGVWWHFFWGNSRGGISGKSGADNGCRLIKYSGNIDLKSINASGVYGGTYTGMIYFKGNFSASYNYAVNATKSYFLLWNNCMQVCIDALRKGKFTQSDLCYKTFLFKIRSNVIPNAAYSRLFVFNKITVMWNNAPWYLKKIYMAPAIACLIY